MCARLPTQTTGQTTVWDRYSNRSSGGEELFPNHPQWDTALQHMNREAKTAQRGPKGQYFISIQVLRLWLLPKRWLLVTTSCHQATEVSPATGLLLMKTAFGLSDVADELGGAAGASNWNDYREQAARGHAGLAGPLTRVSGSTQPVEGGQPRGEVTRDSTAVII